MGTPVPTGVGTEKTEGGYARKASGLVRDFSQLDTWIYNVIALNLVINVAFIYVAVTTTYPHASMWLAIVICAVFCTFEAVVYAFFVSVMPRSGGDYVFQSRVLGGGVATLFAFTAVCLTQIIFIALSSYLGATLVISPFLLLLGAENGWGWAIDVGNWLNTNIGIFLTQLSVIAWAAFVNIRGVRFYALVQRYFFWVGMACFVIVMGAFVATSHSDFVNNFNGFISDNYGINGAYAKTIEAGGTVGTSFSLGDTLKAAVIFSLVLAFPMWGVAQAGEIKRAGSLKDNILSIAGAEVFAAVAMALTAALVVSRVGSDFLYASGTLYFEGADTPLPVPPFFGFFVAVAAHSQIFIWITFLMFICWFSMIVPNAPLAGARVMMAMSFDRVLPQWFGEVSKRHHTPVNSIAVICVLASIVSALYAFSEDFKTLTLGMIVPSLTAFGVTMVAAILLPSRRRAMFNSTVAAKHKWFNLPAMSVCAAIFLVFVAFVDYQCLTADELGINQTKGLIFIGALYAVAAVTYLVSKFYRRRKENLDLSLVYQELPVE